MITTSLPASVSGTRTAALTTLRPGIAFYCGFSYATTGVLASRAPVFLHYRGGTSRDSDGLLWEINGTQGDIRVSGPSGNPQMVRLSLKGARGSETEFRPLQVPASYRSGWPEDVVPGNVARLYARMARDLREGTRTAPSFEDAVALHRVVAAIEKAAENGSRTAPA